MTFEMLFKDRFVLKHPSILLPFSFFMAIVSQLLAMVFFKHSSEIVAIALVTIPLVQIFMQLMKDQEKHIVKDHSFVLKHSILLPFMYMFIGLVLAFTAMYVVFPDELRDEGFSYQIERIYSLEGPFGFSVFTDKQVGKEKTLEQEGITIYSCLSLGIDKREFEHISFDRCYLTDYNANGIPEILLAKDTIPVYVISERGTLYSYNVFIARHIFFNNLQVLAFIFITSFMFGAGAIFVLAWNASIVGVFLGDALQKTANYVSGNMIFAYTLDLPRIIGGLLIHGIFEFFGFFIAAIAGGVLSVAMLKHTFKSKAFHTAVFTSIVITLIATGFLLIGAILESFISL